MKNNILRVAAIVGVILLIPVFGNLFIEGWNWGLLDFIVVGGLLFATGLTIDFIVRRFNNPVHKFTAVGLVILLFLLVWVELAVDAVSQLLVR